MSKFKALASEIETRAAPAALPPLTHGKRAKARIGKMPIGGYFSRELNRDLRQLAFNEGTTMQALIGEALDLLMRARGKHPFGER